MENNKFIITEPELYLQAQSKTLDQRLSKITISKEQEQDIIKNKTIKTIRDKILGSFKLGDVISTCLNWNEGIDGELKKAKKDVLLEEFFDSVENHEEAISNIKLLITNPQGNTLFNMVLRILDDSPPDLELIGHLSTALKYIVENGKFQEMFEKHKFALAQIEKLSPQALTILCDYKSYPDFNIGSVAVNNGKVSSEWNTQFVQAYCLKKEITSSEIITRVSHVIIQLQTQGYLGAYASKENTYYCKVTSIGSDLLPYITVSI